MIAVIAALAAGLAAPVAIEGARVEVGDGTVLEHATVVVDHGRIVSVGTGAAPAGAERVDGRGKVLSPGLVETLCQIGVSEVFQEEATVDARLHDGALLPGFRVADGFNPLSAHIPTARGEGITSVVVSPTGAVVYGTGAWADLTGTLSSRPDPATPAAMFGGIGAEAAQAASGARGGVWLRLRQLVEDARFYRQNRAAFDRGDSRQLVVSPLHLAAMQPVLDGRIPLVLDADRASDILAAIAFGKAEGVRVVIAGGAEAYVVRRELAAAKVPVILRPADLMPGSFDALRARDDAPMLLAQAGVPLVITSGTFTERRARQEAGIAAANGLPHADAVRAITSRPAEVFGKAGEVGMVRAGLRANLVLWSGDPLEVTTAAERVWIDGVPMSLDNRQRRLVERYLGAARPAH